MPRLFPAGPADAPSPAPWPANRATLWPLLAVSRPEAFGLKQRKADIACCATAMTGIDPLRTFADRLR